MSEALQSTPANMASLYAALARAIGRAGAVEKTAENTFHRYKYASAEGLISEARGALAAEGLCVFPRWWKLKPHAGLEQRTGSDGKSLPPGYFADVEVLYIVAHADGAFMECEAITPVICEKGRPEDKALAGALTYSLGYFLRALLLLPRVDEENDVDQRDDSDYQGRQSRDPRQDDRSGHRGATKLPDTAPAAKSAAKSAAAPAFDVAAVLAKVAMAESRDEAIAACVGVEGQPAEVRARVREAIKAAFPAAAKPPADAAQATEAAPAEPAIAHAPAANDAGPAPTADPAWAAVLTELAPVVGADTAGWSTDDVMAEFATLCEKAEGRAAFVKAATPWITVTNRGRGPIAGEVRRAVKDQFDATVAALRAREAAAERAA